MIAFNLDSKVMVLHHNDFDGCVASIIVGNVFKNVYYAPTEFYNIDKKMKLIDYDAFDVVFVVDCHPSNVSYLDISEKIILLDHHKSPYHNPSKGRFVINDKKRSAGWVVKTFFEKKFKNLIDLSHLNRLVKLADDYDCWIKRFPLSTFIADMYKSRYLVFTFKLSIYF